MTFDVTGRLDQGRPSVSHTQIYVAACHTLGYQHQDLTAHAAQVIEWYGAEDGMDLAALDADCARLRAAASAAEEALRLTREAGAALADGWAGESASDAVAFVQRHGASGAALVNMLRTAADGCAALRDTLWRLVGDKAHTAVVIDDRRAEVRAAWLTAAQTVMSGAADRTEAVDVVAHQITPYVDADIRSDWVGAMRAATTSVANAYDDAVRRLTGVATASFEIPGQLGPPAPQPARTAAPAVPVPAVVPPAVTVPAAAAVEPSAAPPPPPPPLAAADPANMAVPPPVPQTTLPEPAGIGGAAPAGLPAAGDLGGGLSGLAGQISDALGGLLSGQPDPVDAPPTADQVDQVTDPQPDDAQPATDDPKDAQPEPDSPEPEEAEPATPVEDAPADDAPAPEPPPPPPPPADPPAAPPPPSAEPVVEPTPCEIAADELPQVGQ
ncbi:hypothetical protein [Candidatus Mycolicibacterium alkanivorans]|uniref:Uncharacterized protein n=1 Tax=Candidatus Mycolicibacterium alkanivorans TaxID=2954114 RepID=A0ABS9Z095_9MYCO|nr:hypothetical protein [Candidatus Mycolicibacterium alkanivorans]MCI4676936.1 hypothetical protein [Candidatus Mycolicibacterium alkanivorans]